MRERPLDPPEEVANRFCPECSAALLSGDTVYKDQGNFTKVLGCERCLCWKAIYNLNYNPSKCPNCEEQPGDDTRVLVVSDSVDVVIACEECVNEWMAGEVLEEYEPEPYDYGGI